MVLKQLSTLAMHFKLKLLNRKSFLHRKVTETKRNLEYLILIAAEGRQDLDRFAPIGIHLPLYVISALCLVPIRCVKTVEKQHLRLKVASGWRRVLCFFFHFVLIARALCVFSLSWNENFHWTYHENFTADAAVFSIVYIFCSYAMVGILYVHYCGAEICELYNAVRTVSARLAGKAEDTANTEHDEAHEGYTLE